MNRYGKGIWAGSIRYYKDKFWVYFGTPDEGFFMSSASNPAGPWEPLHKLWSVSYRGDRIGIFNFNTKEDKGFVDVDWFRYKYD